MNFKELLEGSEPKMPGAPSGIKIMTPQQFVASAGDSKSDDEVSEGPSEVMGLADFSMGGGIPGGQSPADIIEFAQYDHNDDGDEDDDELRSLYDTKAELEAELDYAEDDEEREQLESDLEDVHARIQQIKPDAILEQGVAEGSENILPRGTAVTVLHKGKQVPGKIVRYDAGKGGYSNAYVVDIGEYESIFVPTNKIQQGVAEGQEHLDRIRKLSGLDEATKLPAQTRDLGSQEYQDYMNRIVGTPDIDKKTGQVKKQKDRTSKKTGEVIPGKDKYISGKTKSDKYKLPYIHRNSAVQYLGPDGNTFSEEKIISALKQRPKSLLKQNEKMRHSNGEQEQFFNVGFAALTGIAVDEQTGKLIIVNTCPGAGACKVDCFVIQQGGKIQFEGPWLNDGRILTYLLNDPDGFFNQISSEISKETQLGKKNDYNVTIRWHDSGDFFSPEYLGMALKLAEKHPNNKFYAYTKMAGAALAKKPDNFIINWSEGAHTSQEKQVKAQDPTLSSTKNSRIVPEEMFQDLLAKDEKKSLIKGSQGQWQLQPGKLPELKQRLAQEYKLSPNSMLSYDEYMAKRNKIPAGMKYNVIVMGGEGDVSANDPGVLSTLLLKH